MLGILGQNFFSKGKGKEGREEEGKIGVLVYSYRLYKLAKHAGLK